MSGLSRYAERLHVHGKSLSDFDHRKFRQYLPCKVIGLYPVPGGWPDDAAGGRQTNGWDGFRCRILVVFEGAGFDLSFSIFLPAPVTLSTQNRSSTIEYC